MEIKVKGCLLTDKLRCTGVYSLEITVNRCLLIDKLRCTDVYSLTN